MKRLQTTEKVIGEYVFYIRPFGAFTASNISGDLAAVLTPMLGSLSAAFKSKNGEKKIATDENGKINIMDVEIEDVLPAIGDALSQLSGDKFEKILMKLLIVHKNISVCGVATNGNTVTLDRELADEVFCTDLQDMLILALEVIKINFSGFFKKLAGRFGFVIQATQKKTPTTASTEN